MLNPTLNGKTVILRDS